MNLERNNALNPDNPWLAIPMTHQGFKEIYAMLLTAKATGMPVTVVTSGSMTCGYAEISYMYAP